MTEQTIPAEKVRELAAKYDGDVPTDPHFLLGEIKADLRALLPTPQPITGLLGRWAKHPDYGDVMCAWDKPGSKGDIPVRWMAENEIGGLCGTIVPLSSLTFSHQATCPEEVPAGEAWRVSHCGYGEFNAVKTSGPFPWRFFNPEIEEHDGFRNNSVTLIYPLAPERPETDLQAKYDALEKRCNHLDNFYSARGLVLDDLNDKYDVMDAKYREAQERAEALSQDITPRTATIKAEYEALPIGSMLVDADDEVWKKGFSGEWIHTLTVERLTDSEISGTTRTVLRYGWGDEQPKPAWRIETDRQNLRAGEYVIDADGDTGTINRAVRGNDVWCVGMASTSRECGPWIAFVNKEAATLEAIEEAKKARDKETGE